MLSIAIELRADCPACGNSIPINSPGERFVCPACSQELTISNDGWRALLEVPLSNIDHLVAGEPHRQDLLVGAPFHLTYAAQFPQCPNCKDRVSDEAIASQRALPCAKCGHPIGSKAAPPAFAALGVKFVVEVAESHPDSPNGRSARSEPAMMHCPDCGAKIELDGTRRTLNCTYCSAEVVIPDGIWQRIHGVSEVQQWYLCRESRANAAESGGAHVSSLRGEVWGIVIDRENNAYLLVYGDYRMYLWCTGPDLMVKWTAEVPYDDRWGHRDHLNVALNPEGNIVVWKRQSNVANAYSRSDGSTIGTSPAKESVLPWYSWKNDSCELHGSWDGRSYRIEMVETVNEGLLTASRSEAYSRLALPLEYADAMGCDALGRLHVLGRRHRSYECVLLRFTPDGRRIDVIAYPISEGGPLGKEDGIAVAQNGTVFAYRRGGQRLCVFAPDGGLIFRGAEE